MKHKYYQHLQWINEDNMKWKRIYFEPRQSIDRCSQFREIFLFFVAVITWICDFQFHAHKNRNQRCDSSNFGMLKQRTKKVELKKNKHSDDFQIQNEIWWRIFTQNGMEKVVPLWLMWLRCRCYCFFFFHLDVFILHDNSHFVFVKRVSLHTHIFEIQNYCHSSSKMFSFAEFSRWENQQLTFAIWKNACKYLENVFHTC